MSLQIETVESVFPEVRVSSHGDHTEYIVHCRKFHKKGGKYKLSINADSGVFICHDCGWVGNAFSQFFDEASQFFSGMQVHRTDNKVHLSRGLYLNTKKEWQDGVPSPGEMHNISALKNGHPALKYLNERNISHSLADESGIKYCSKGYFDFCSRMGTTSGRIIFPVFMNKKLMGWQARQIEVKANESRFIWKGETQRWWETQIIELSTGEKKYEDYNVPKYYTCPGMQRSSCLLNFDSATNNRNFVVVVEGPIDALKVGKNSVATFGKQLTNNQVRLIKSNWSRVLMILDSEINPNEEWFRKLEKNFQGVYFIYMKLTGFHDAGEADSKTIWKQITDKFGDLNDYNPKIPR